MNPLSGKDIKKIILATQCGKVDDLKNLIGQQSVDLNDIKDESEKAVLLLHEAIITAKDEDVAIKTKVEMVEYLLEKKANVNAVDEENQQTALMLAAEKGYYNIVKLLLQKGANKGANKKSDDDQDKKTPLQLAVKNHHYLTAILLRDDYKVEKTMLFSSAIITAVGTFMTVIATLEMTGITPKAIPKIGNTNLILSLSIPFAILGLSILLLARYMTHSKISSIHNNALANYSGLTSRNGSPGMQGETHPIPSDPDLVHGSQTPPQYSESSASPPTGSAANDSINAQETAGIPIEPPLVDDATKKDLPTPEDSRSPVIQEDASTKAVPEVPSALDQDQSNPVKPVKPEQKEAREITN